MGPELVYLVDEGRIKVDAATDAEALRAFKALSEKEGIISALESAHAIHQAVKIARGKNKNED